MPDMFGNPTLDDYFKQLLMQGAMGAPPQAQAGSPYNVPLAPDDIAAEVAREQPSQEGRTTVSGFEAGKWGKGKSSPMPGGGGGGKAKPAERAPAAAPAEQPPAGGYQEPFPPVSEGVGSELSAIESAQRETAEFDKGYNKATWMQRDKASTGDAYVRRHAYRESIVDNAIMQTITGKFTDADWSNEKTQYSYAGALMSSGRPKLISEGRRILDSLNREKQARSRISAANKWRENAASTLMENNIKLFESQGYEVTPEVRAHFQNEAIRTVLQNDPYTLQMRGLASQAPEMALLPDEMEQGISRLQRPPEVPAHLRKPKAAAGAGSTPAPAPTDGKPATWQEAKKQLMPFVRDGTITLQQMRTRLKKLYPDYPGE